MCRTIGCTLGELGERMTSAEFSVWWSEYRRNPWGEQRDALHTAMLGQAIANYAGKVRKEPAKLTDFLLDFDRDDEPAAEPDPMTFFKQFSK